MVKKKTKEKQKDNKEDIPDHISEYFNYSAGNKEAIVNKELFRADKDVDIKTDLTWEEIILCNKIIALMEFYKKVGLIKVFNLYFNFMDHYLRLKISLLRKSRGEFVDVNKQQASVDQATQLLNDLNGLKDSKK